MTISATPDIPSQIGRYRVQRLLGRGAMGVVYAAHDPVIDRPVAIKLVRVDLLSGEDREDFLARFRREAQAAGRCMHPNIVAVYDFSMHEGNPFLAMEYVEGLSLADRLRQSGRIAPDAAVQLVLQVLDALGLAHMAGVVHRDVKPANILLVSDHQVKMTDFGIARFDNTDQTRHGAIIGTPSYMSPEQCRGDPVDARTDVFSTGAVLYEMLTGERPFGRGGTTQVIYRLMHEEPPAIVTPHPAVPPALTAVLRRALAKRVEARFPSAQAMAAALRAAPEETVVLSSPATTQTGIAQAELGRVEQALAERLGPIARVLVKRALREAQSPAELWQILATHIDRPADREAFLRQAPR